MSEESGTALYQWLEEREDTLRRYVTEADTELESEYYHGQYDLAKNLRAKMDGGVFDDE